MIFFLQSCQGKSYKMFFWRFFLLIFFYWCVVRSRFLLLTQRARLREPFRYLEHVRKVNKNFLGAFEKKVSKNGVLSKYSNSILSSMFSKSQLFSKASRKFLLTLRTRSRYLKGPLNLALCVRKKS